MKKAGGFIAEFKEFIEQGSVMDMAVGIIVGGAFKSIVDSLVEDMLMPIIGIFVGADSFASLSVTIGGAVIKYGNFISTVINFLILAFVLFLMVKALNTINEKARALKKKEEAEEEAAAEPTKEEVLLTEIRDLLKKQAG
ncbi:MAG: large-conductance mechanosensitive channel protein MscL [Lachnospiraceae bacterium]|nr:large-conductance mechanosensitive channel protein MscL [Lachnospiraceae bacterium]